MIALVGDYRSTVTAHVAIPEALALVQKELGTTCAYRWVATSSIRDPAQDFRDSTAIWVVPASPYASMAGALSAIRFARETGRPFLGTCGGFQHAVIEFARHVAGLPAADHAETNPAAETQLVTPLACSLVGQVGRLHFTAGSRLREIYPHATVEEGYHCSYGINAAHRQALEEAGLRFTAFDDAGEIRGFELPAATHPFFFGTLFQPERTALRGEVPPLVRAFVQVAHSFP